MTTTITAPAQISRTNITSTSYGPGTSGGRIPGGPPIRSPGGGGPPGAGGLPGGGGGPPGGGGGPPGGPGGPGQPDSSRFIGKEPQVFTGDRTKAEEFLTQWNLFVGVNLNNAAMQNPYQRCLLFLTYLQGPHVNEWVQSQHRWLVNKVTANGVALTNVWLWTTMERAFRQNFTDMLEQERAQAALKQGFQMKGEDMDNYVAKFERLCNIYHRCFLT